MAEPTLAEIFGTGTSKLASGAATPSEGLFIPASAFTARGVTTFATANPEALFLAIILTSMANLTEPNRALDTTNRNVTVLDSGQDTVPTQDPNIEFRRYIFQVLAYKQNNITTVNVNDF